MTASAMARRSHQEQAMKNMQQEPGYLVCGSDDHLDLCKCPEMRWVQDVGRARFLHGLDKARLALGQDAGAMGRPQSLRDAASVLADVFLRDKKALSFQSRAIRKRLEA